MSTEIKLHKIQSDILCRLLFKQQAKFAELSNGELTNDHFTFHIKKLLELGMISKNASGAYELTSRGKEFANRFDTELKQFEKQAKLGVLVTCVRNETGVDEYLVQKRLKQPFYGFYGFMSGKIGQGEMVAETAARELEEEAGLKAELTLVGVKHKMDYSKSHQLLEDKFFFVFRGENCAGKLVEKFEGGENIWMTEEKILSLDNLFDGVDETLKLVKGEELRFVEVKYLVEGF